MMNTNFLVGVVVGVAGVWAWKKFMTRPAQ